jgi:glycerophosphoryl diester phosphodiesterase
MSQHLNDRRGESVSVGCDAHHGIHPRSNSVLTRPVLGGSQPEGVAGRLRTLRCDDGLVHEAARPVGRSIPQIIAHRGSSRDLPEHTLKAYLRAIEEGADALECDVRLTADSHLVCAHDRNISRTSNGKGLVSTLELATLEGLDFGSWKLAHDGEVEMPDLDHERDKLLTLRRLIDVVMSCGREVGLAIETKHPTRYAGDVERQLAMVLAEFDLDGAYVPGRPHVSVMSFSQLAVARMRQLCPEVPLVYLMDGSVPLRFRDGSLPKGARVAGLDKEIIRRWPKTVRRQHDRGNQVYVFTVDDEPDIEMCLKLGVDAIITNRPAFVREQLCVRG